MIEYEGLSDEVLESSIQYVDVDEFQSSSQEVSKLYHPTKSITYQIFMGKSLSFFFSDFGFEPSRATLPRFFVLNSFTMTFSSWNLRPDRLTWDQSWGHVYQYDLAWYRHVFVRRYWEQVRHQHLFYQQVFQHVEHNHLEFEHFWQWIRNHHLTGM